MSTDDQLNEDYKEILHVIKKMGYKIEPELKSKQADSNFGDSISIAYPIQGLLKYHGMFDTANKIAYFPSISLNNSAFSTITYVKVDPQRKRDIFILNGKDMTHTPEFLRVGFQLNLIREFTKIDSKAVVISRNIDTKTHSVVKGKGLGTSAAGGAALTRAIFNILYDDPRYRDNSRLLSVFSRYLSGSGTRSSVGGIALWLSSPNNRSWDSFAIKLNRNRDSHFINKISLISITFQSTITTSKAHEIAVQSSHYWEWCLSRKSKILSFLRSFEQHDLDGIGVLAEEDSNMIHKIHTSTNHASYWNNHTEDLIKFTHNARIRDIPVYYSIDTGPSVVLITKKTFEEQIVQELRSKIVPHAKIYTGTIGGSSNLISPNSELAHLLDDDIEKFCK